MTISTTDFPIWFFAGFYGGLVCCVITIGISLRTVYADIRRRVIPRRLIAVVIVSFASSLCLLPTFAWFRAHFDTRVSLTEITILLSYVVFFGWLLPIGMTIISFFISRSSSSMLGRHNKQQKKHPEGQWSPPRYQSGVMAPFVFSAETPWGWLEYRSGNFQGQRLALKRSIITLGRGEDCDIWLDDDLASRRHAELAWENNIVYLTDCESLNSTCLNGRKVRGSIVLSSEDIIEIGTQRFLFMLAEQKMVTTDQYDPLVNHKWRSSFELQESRETTQFSLTLPTTRPHLLGEHINTIAEPLPIEQDLVTSRLHSPLSLPPARGSLLIGNGDFAGRYFSLQSLSILVGSGPDCDLVVQNLELAPQHARFIRNIQGDYVQNISGKDQVLINGRIVQGVQLLQHGDHLRFGSFYLTYLSTVQNSVAQDLEGQASYSQKAVPANPPSSNGPIPLRLPSRPKES